MIPIGEYWKVCNDRLTILIIRYEGEKIDNYEEEEEKGGEEAWDVHASLGSVLREGIWL